MAAPVLAGMLGALASGPACVSFGDAKQAPVSFLQQFRDPPRDERPPDVGPHAKWWGEYKPYADACRRLCWLNTDSRHICGVAILGDADFLPDGAAKVCFQHQRDFNYLELRHLWEEARMDEDGVHLAGMTYAAVILDHLQLPAQVLPALTKLAATGRLLTWGVRPGTEPLEGARAASTEEEFIAALDELAAPDLVLRPPSKDLHYRHVVKSNCHLYLLFNEGEAGVTTSLSLPLKGTSQWLDPQTGEATGADLDAPVTFRPHERRVLWVTP